MTMTADGRRGSGTARRMVGGLVVVLAAVGSVSCSSDDSESDTAATEATVDDESTATSTSSTSTTIDESLPPDIDACALITEEELSAAVAPAVGSPGEPIGEVVDLDPTIGSVACRWVVGVDASGGAGAELTLVVETPAYSDVFEAAAADPEAQDPEDIFGVGDQAAYAQSLTGGTEGAPRNWLLVRSGDVVIRLAGGDIRVIDREALLSLAPIVMSRVTA